MAWKFRQFVIFFRRDYQVIGVVWAPILIVPWIEKWYEFLVPIYVSRRDSVDRDYVNLLFNLRMILSCVISLVVAFATDLTKRHYLAWSICLEIYTGAQIFGLVIYYTSITYEAADFVYWASSAIFIGLAVQPCVIFSQNQNAYRYWSHLVLATCQGSLGVSAYILFWVVHDRPHALFMPLGHYEILPWVAIASFLLFITLIRVFKKYSPAGRAKRHSLKASFKVLGQSFKKTGPSGMLKYALMMSIIATVCIPIAIYSALWHLDINSDGLIDVERMSEHSFLLGRAFGFILIEAFLLGIRKLNRELSDVLSLGVPLILFFIVIIIIYYRLTEIRQLQKAATKTLEEQIEQAEVFVGPIPSKKQAVIEFYNTMTRTIKVVSPSFILEGPLIPQSRIGVGLNFTGTVTIKVILIEDDITGQDDERILTVQSKNDTEWSKCACVYAELDRFHSFVIHGNKTNIGILTIYDHSMLKPTINPVIVIMNTFMNTSDKHERILLYEVSAARHVAFFQSYPPFSPNTSIVETVPIAEMKVIYQNLGEIEDHRNPNDKTVSALITEPFVIYATLITLENGKGYMGSHEIMRVSISKDNVHIPKIQHCVFVQSAFVTLGTAYSSLMVALYHHFWMDSPTRLRATMMSVCLGSHQVTKYLVDRNKLLQPEQALTMVILMGVAVVWHFSISSLYFCFFEHGSRSDEKDDANARNTPSPPRKSIEERPKQVKFTSSAEPVAPVDL